jgi:AcrR family transcriptional regulator
MNDKLLDATVEVLGEHGLAGVTLERVADRVGVSRVTLWRQGVTRETLIDGLLDRLVHDFRQRFWPVMTLTGTGREQLEATLEALFDVADRHLALLAVSDEVFHWAAGRAHSELGGMGFLDPFVSALRRGRDDGSLAIPGRIDDLADVLFNGACWGYVHLRHRHRWSRARGRRHLVPLFVAGAAAPPPLGG